MIEAVAIPILTKAVDFLFDECKKVLEERRERRAKTVTAEKSPPKADEPTFSKEPHVETDSIVISDRQNAMKTAISEAAWLNAENRVKHLISLLEIHWESYKLYKKQTALWGDALVPPVILSGLKKAEEEIIAISLELQDILSKVYGIQVTAIKREDLLEGR